jgi:hypothetical protein
MGRKKYLLFLAFLFIFLFLNSGFANALEIKNYPKIPGVTTPSENCAGNNCLPIYISYWVGILIYIAGILALVSFTIGAIGFLASFDNAEKKSNAKDRMKGATLGLVLTMTSFLILKTINPVLVTPTLSLLPGVEGIFCSNGSENIPCPMESSDTTLIPEGYRNIKYACSNGPALLIWEFPEPGLEGGNEDLSKVKVKKMNCGDEPEDISNYGSFKMAFDAPGIYYCLGGCGGGDMCSGYMSYAVTSSEGNIANPFNGKIEGVRIINDSTKDIYYGAVFHKEAGLENAGECTKPVINTGKEGTCKNIKDYGAIKISAGTVFRWNNDNATVSSGSGVTLYSEPFGSAAGAQKRGEGFCAINNNTIGNTFSKNAGELSFNNGSDYGCGYAKNTNDATKNLYKNTYRTFSDKPGSIDIKGRYLVILFGDDAGNNDYGDNFNSDDSGSNTSSYCQIFSQSVPNLKVQPFVATGHPIGSIYIIPIK